MPRARPQYAEYGSEDENFDLGIFEWLINVNIKEIKSEELIIDISVAIVEAAIPYGLD